MDIYNLEKLIKIEIKDAIRSKQYAWQKEKNFWLFRNEPEGYYDIHWGDYLGKKIPDNHEIIGGVLFEKPKVTFYFQGNHRSAYYFDTYEDAKLFGQKTAEKGNYTYG